MSKAEEKSLKVYPQKIEWVGNQWDGAPFDVNSESRVAYKQGYNQAEKDNELTWEDIENIITISYKLDKEEEISGKYAKLMTHYQEVLKRYKENR